MLLTPFGVRPLAQEPLCIGEPSTHMMTLLFCALVGMAGSLKVTTIGEKVLLRKAHNFFEVGRFHLQYMQSLLKFRSWSLISRGNSKPCLPTID
jgi:hypothetical protein